MDKYIEFQKNREKNDFSLQYMAIGLGGEVGEFLNEIKKLERDDNNIMNDERKNKILNEMGDILWYFQGICRRLDTNIENIMITNIKKLTNK